MESSHITFCVEDNHVSVSAVLSGKMVKRAARSLDSLMGLAAEAERLV